MIFRLMASGKMSNRSKKVALGVANDTLEVGSGHSINKNLMKIIEILSKSMKINGNQWKSMEINGNPWKSMKSIGFLLILEDDVDHIRLQ